MPAQRPLLLRPEEQGSTHHEARSAMTPPIPLHPLDAPAPFTAGGASSRELAFRHPCCLIHNSIKLRPESSECPSQMAMPPMRLCPIGQRGSQLGRLALHHADEIAQHG